MQRRDFVKMGLATVALAAVPSLPALAASVQDNFKTLDPLVGKAMEAYNSNNWKAFYANWADQVKGICTEQAFTGLYQGVYRKQYGTFKGRKLVEAKSNFTDAIGLLVYNADFSSKKATLSVNFFSEGGKFKIQQIRIDPAS